LVEAETGKARFLRQAVDELGLQSRVSVVHSRIEDWLRSDEPLVKGGGLNLVFRAVGPLARIYSWIGKCSTWNKLTLLKGPSWEEELRSARDALKGKTPKTTSTHNYITPSGKPRVIVGLQR
jgi:16S rRNA G527 N7-methylase RsmG